MVGLRRTSTGCFRRKILITNYTEVSLYDEPRHECGSIGLTILGTILGITGNRVGIGSP